MESIKIIDLHSHILPGLDDGSQSLEESLAMARMAVQSGVRTVVATPHCDTDRSQEVRKRWLLLREALEDLQIPLRILPGMEILGGEKTAGLLQGKKLMTLNNSRYPLIEFSFQAEAEENSRILQSVIRAGYRPLIAHPERYDCVREDPVCIDHWHDMGCLFQINRGSLLGRFGGVAQELALSLVDRGFATVVASDAHSPRMRTPWMLDVYRLLEEEFSPAAARCLLWQNPERILNNESIPTARPARFG